MSARKTPHKPGPPHPSWSCQLCSLLCLPLPSRVFGVSHPVCPSNPMSLVPLTLFAPPLSCFWSSLPCLPLPSHVFGAPHSVCPSPPMFLVFLTRRAARSKEKRLFSQAFACEELVSIHVHDAFLVCLVLLPLKRRTFKI